MMSFSYLRDTANGYDKALWNCGEFDRPQLNQCMKLQVLVPATPKKVEDIFLRDLGPDTTPIPMAAAQPAKPAPTPLAGADRSEEHTSELQSLMRTSYAVFCLTNKTQVNTSPLLTPT